MLSVRTVGWCDSDAIVLMCCSQTKLQKLSLTYECKHETKTEKFYWEKQRIAKIVISDTKSCPVQLESGPLKVSCHRINYRPKTIWDDCCTIVQLSSDAIVRWDCRPNPNCYHAGVSVTDHDSLVHGYWYMNLCACVLNCCTLLLIEAQFHFHCSTTTSYSTRWSHM